MIISVFTFLYFLAVLFLIFRGLSLGSLEIPIIAFLGGIYVLSLNLTVLKNDEEIDLQGFINDGVRKRIEKIEKVLEIKQ